MWTKQTRGRMAGIERRTKRYPSDLTNEEWDRIAPLLPKVARRGRRPSVDLREIWNAIRYVARSGGGWRMLPQDRSGSVCLNSLGTVGKWISALVMLPPGLAAAS